MRCTRFELGAFLDFTLAQQPWWHRLCSLMEEGEEIGHP
jgi:hypothetical protein